MKHYIPTLALFLFACDSDKAITVFNPNPEAEITSHADGDEVLEGYVITFIGNVDDANHTADKLRTIWKLGNTEICPSTPPSSDGITTCDTVLAPEDSEITLEVRDSENALGSATVTLSVTPSQAPTCEINSPEESGVYYSDQLITFSGTITDAEDDAELLTGFWESNIDGVLSDVDATPSSEGLVQGYGLLSEGQHAIELKGEDATGKTCLASVIIAVGPPNTAPLCEITEPIDNSAGPEGDAIQFVATTSDVDVPSDMLTVTWTSDKDGDLGESTPTSTGDITFSYSDLSVNQHNITMTVTDEVGATCTTAINYTVGTPPNITIAAPTDGETYSEGDAITFSATVSDAQDQPDEVVLDWMLNGTSVSTQGAASTGTAQWSDSSLDHGSYSLEIMATDSDGLTDNSNIVNFTINGLPTQPAIGIDPNHPDTSDTLTVVIDTPSIDPEGSTINYTYEWLLGGAVQSAYTSSTVPSSATNKNEQWTVRVTPNDGIADGPTGEATVTIENTPPTLSSLAIIPNSNIHNDTTLTCSVVVTDPDETLTPAYEWSIGSTVVGSGSTLDLSAAGAMPDDVVTCSVSVVDGDGALASDSTTTIVENRQPTVTGATITPATGVTTSTALTCAATVTDDDGENITPSYTWLVGSNTYGGDSLHLDSTMVSPSDTVTCTISAEDGYGGTASDSASVTVDNTLPVASASISVSGAGNTAELTCSAVASDIDDNPTVPTVHLEWFDTNGLSLGTSNPLQLDTSMGVDGDDISCVATATDLSGGIANDTAIYTITNTPPTIDSISLTPTSPDVTTTALTCNVTGSDADGDSVTFAYEWLVDNQTQTETSSGFAGPFVVGTTIVCRATPNDGKIDGNVLEDTVIVANTAPVIDSVTLSPSPVYTNDTIIATAVLLDDDTTQTVSATYAWHVIDFQTGIDTEVQSGTNSTLSGVSFFDRDDEVYVIVTPNDGLDDGSPFTSGSITISNTAPTAPSISLSPNPADAGQDDLVCSIDTPSSDDDGDSVVYTYVWTDNSGTVQQTTTNSASTTDTFMGSGTTVGTWTCEVTPYDGIGTGNSATTNTAVGTNCPGQDANITTQTEADSYIPCVELNSISLHMTSAVTSVNLPNLVTVHNSIYFHANNDLQEVSLPVLETVGGYAYFYHNYYLTEVDLDALQSVGKYLYFDGNSVLESTGLDSDLSLIEEYSYFSNNTLLCVPDLDWSTITQDYHYDNGNLDCADLDGDGIQAWEDCDDDDSSIGSSIDDADCDGVATADDCDDNDPTIYPYAGDTYGDGVDSDCDGLDCNAVLDGSSYFASCPGPLSWQQGLDSCVNAGYDGLATILNNAENSLILSLTNEYFAWFGYTDIQTEGVWVWSSGLSSGFSNWWLYQPNNGNNEDCGGIYGLGNSSSQVHGRWNDSKCHVSEEYICEKRGL